MLASCNKHFYCTTTNTQDLTQAHVNNIFSGLRLSCPSNNCKKAHVNYFS